MAKVELVGVSKAFKDVRVLQELTLTIDDGQFLVLLGPSGCGKSTTLNIVGGLEDPDTGDVFMDGTRVTELPPNKRDVGMAFQSYALYPQKTVRENLSFGLRVRGTPRREAEQRAAEIAKTLEIEHLLSRKPGQLSGGQQQRVALGRALVRRPSVLLMDEPLSNLDAALRVRMRTEIRQLQQRFGVTTVFVTHDQEEAMSLGDAVAVMDHGAIRQLGAPMDVYNKPADLVVARFVGLPQMHTVDAEIERGEVRVGALRIPTGFDHDGPVVLGTRPEHLALTNREEEGWTIPGRVTVVEPLGRETVVGVDTELGQVMVCIDPLRRDVVAGMLIQVRWPSTHLHVFDAQTGKRLEENSPGERSPVMGRTEGSSL
jgi:ABC-type sugar transport system ATPase subunit